MTTIAWDGKTLAADSQCSAGNVISSITQKKIVVVKGNENWKIRGEEVLAFAFAGDACAMLEIADHLSRGLHSGTTMRAGIDFHAVVCTRQSIFEVQKSEGAEDIVITIAPDVWAIGSGCDFALSALKMGKSAKEAVEHAISLDLYSGGEVQTFELRDKNQR